MAKSQKMQDVSHENTIFEALEPLLDPSGAEKTSLERLLGAPRGIPREISAVLKAKRLPKRSPGGSKIGSRRRLELKRAKSQNLEDV